MVKNILFTAIASSALLSGVCAHAEESPFYVGVEFGTADHESEFSVDFTTGSGSISESDSGSKLFFGYRATPSLAIEIQYADLGESSLEVADNSTVLAGGVSTTFGLGEGGTLISEITSVGVSGVYRFNIDGAVKPFVKLGLHRWEIEGTSTSSLVSSGKDTGTDIFYGVGVDIAIAEQWALTVSYDLYNIDSDQDSIEEVSTFGAGINYKF